MNRTKDCRKNKRQMSKHAQMTTLTSFPHSLANQKNLIFLLGLILPSASIVNKRSGSFRKKDLFRKFLSELKKMMTMSAIF